MKGVRHCLTIPRRSVQLPHGGMIELDPTVVPPKSVNGYVNARKIPGKFQTAPVTLSPALHASLAEHVYKQNVAEMKKDAEKLQNLLWKRQMSWPDWLIRAKAREFGTKLSEKLKKKSSLDEQDNTEEAEMELEKKVKDQVIKRLRAVVYHWTPVGYNSEYDCLVYATARLAPELSVLTRIFTELKARDPQFKPEFLLDFGSGLASAYWASNTLWPNVTKEYVGVDTSRHMNDLALSLIRGAEKRDHLKSPSNGIFFRQFLSGKHDRKFNLVVCAYSLMELESYEERMAIVGSLWQKTEEFLVIVENGTFAGHKAVLQARDHILNAGRQVDVRKVRDELTDNYDLEDSEVNNLLNTLKDPKLKPSEGIPLPDNKGILETTTLLPEGYVFAPCPHDLVCPRLKFDSQPCNFLARYELPTFSMKKPDRFNSEFFSFVVLRKGSRPADDIGEVKSSWPRIVGHPLVRGDQVWCRLCNSNGNLEEIPISKGRHGSVMFRCAKDRNWGDLLPVQSKANDSPDEQ